jgi:tellurite resistance protein TehA-like permease
MGTGITSVLLHNLPFDNRGLYWISVVIFAINVLLLILFLAASICRYILYPGLWSTMIRHPVMPLLLGAFPIGLATIITMIVLVCVPAWGYWALILVRARGILYTNALDVWISNTIARPGCCGGLMSSSPS